MSAEAECPLCGYHSKHISVPHDDFSWLFSDASVDGGVLDTFYTSSKMVWRCPSCKKSVAIENEEGEWEWFIRQEERSES